MIDLSLLWIIPLSFHYHKSCLKLYFLSNHLSACESIEQHKVANSDPFDTQLEIPAEFNNVSCVGFSDFLHLTFEILIYQNDKQGKARCLTEVLCVTTIILSAQIMIPFKEDVEAGNSLFSLEVTGVMLIIYLSVTFLYVNDHRDLIGQLFLSIAGWLVRTFILSLGLILLTSTFPTDILFFPTQSVLGW